MTDRKLFLLAACVLMAAPLYICCKAAQAQEFGCDASARWLRYACVYAARDSRHTSIAQCQDASIVDGACLDAADADFEDTLQECGEVFAARLDLCEVLGDEPHEPPFGVDFAANFVDPTEIGAMIAPNPWFPLVVGNTWVYEGPEETITVVVTDKTKLIDGINCRVVNDIVTDGDGFLIEDTDDWYAQDTDGNVWYCGEIAENFELFEGDDPEVVELVDIDGSWKHGRDSAKAGMLLPFEPQVGDLIRQEVLYTDAEDVIEILSVTATESAAGGACVDTCLQTLDYTPLEPGVQEHKFYAPGIGMIVEINLEDGERVELVEFTGVGS